MSDWCNEFYTFLHVKKTMEIIMQKILGTMYKI